MLAIRDFDIFVFMNAFRSRFGKTWLPAIHFGVSDFFATGVSADHVLVVDAADNFNRLSPPPVYATEGDTILWDEIEAYRAARPPKRFKLGRSTAIDDILTEADKDDKHSLSALLSNFTPTARPAVKAKVLAFLRDPKAKYFVLPPEMVPKRGRAVGYYETAIATDFSKLKADIVGAQETFEARYWSRVLAKDRADGT